MILHFQVTCLIYVDLYVYITHSKPFLNFVCTKKHTRMSSSGFIALAANVLSTSGYSPSAGKFYDNLEVSVSSLEAFSFLGDDSSKKNRLDHMYKSATEDCIQTKPIFPEWYCWLFRNRAPPRMYKNLVNNGINYQPQLVSKISHL